MEWTDLSAYSTLVFYALATAASLSGVLGRLPRLKSAARLLCLCGFAPHTLWLAAMLFTGGFAQVSRGFYLMPFAWLLTLGGLFIPRRKSMDLILHIVVPWAFFLCACALGFSDAKAGTGMAGPIFIMHIASMFVGVGVMAIAAGAGMVFLWQERSIKHRLMRSFRLDLPSLNTLDRINAISVLFGFPCYCLGMLCGFLWAHISWQNGADIKEWVSLGILLLYAFLFHQRFAIGWSGRKPAMLAIAIFAASLFSMFVINTAFSMQHNF
ncbi:MAG: cytochrome c biogenesis protein CcsA [Mailhella sp.]|nr:cytochrome c biogenesis protein CcsA [Mailhella sp.]